MKSKKFEVMKNVTGKKNFSAYCNNVISVSNLSQIKGGDGEEADDFIIIEDTIDL